MPDPIRFTNADKLAEVRREIKQRHYVYPKRVEAGKMTKALSDRQIALMESIAEDYEKLAASERLL